MSALHVKFPSGKEVRLIVILAAIVNILLLFAIATKIYDFNIISDYNGMTQTLIGYGFEDIKIEGGNHYLKKKGGDYYYFSGTLENRNVYGVCENIFDLNSNKFIWSIKLLNQ